MTAADTAFHSPIIGIVGWKNSGKTTLVTRLVAHFSAEGMNVSTIKHAHHDFQVDDGQTDSARHRRAGANQVAVVSQVRWAIIGELRSNAEPSLPDIASRLEPCDLIIVEGYKQFRIPKIEVRRQESRLKQHLSEIDDTVIAIASDHERREASVPRFELDDIASIASFILESVASR